MSYARYLYETYGMLDESALDESMLIEQCIEENYDILSQMNEEEIQEFIGKWIQAARDKVNNSRIGAGINKLSGDAINNKSTHQRNTENDFYGSLKTAMADKKFPSAQRARKIDGQAAWGGTSDTADAPTFDAGKSVRHYIAGRKSAQSRANRIGAAQRQGRYAAQRAIKRPMSTGIANSLYEKFLSQY